MVLFLRQEEVEKDICFFGGDSFTFPLVVVGKSLSHCLLPDNLHGCSILCCLGDEHFIALMKDLVRALMEIEITAVYTLVMKEK